MEGTVALCQFGPSLRSCNLGFLLPLVYGSSGRERRSFASLHHVLDPVSAGRINKMEFICNIKNMALGNHA